MTAASTGTRIFGGIRSCTACLLLSKTKIMAFQTISILLVLACMTSSGALDSQSRYRQRRALNRLPILSYWANWGPWSACSRTCGGGVAAQSRACLMRSRGEGGELRESTHCVGLYKQYKLCNSELCPENKDFRQEQCESHNKVPFMGKLYQWKSIQKEPKLCELNCKAVGFHFYAKLTDKVVDGTPCRKSSTDICVDGMCKAIGCDGILGSGLKLDKCGVCGGSNTQCEIMSGVFTSSVGHGYRKMITIPAGAMYINVTEIKNSRNYLALEGTNGNKYINMDWKIDHPGNYSVAGTFFIYRRLPGRTGIGERFLAKGPTTEDLNLILIKQQENPGIAYEFSIPLANAEEKMPPAAPVRGQVIVRQDAPASSDQASDGVSLSTFLNAGQPAPIFSSTVSKNKPRGQDAGLAQDASPPESSTSLGSQDSAAHLQQQSQMGHNARADASGQQQQEQQGDLQQETGKTQHDKGHKGHQRGQQGGDQNVGQSDAGDGENLPEETPQADSGTPRYPMSSSRGIETQARQQPETVYQQTPSREQTDTRYLPQGQSYPSQGQDPRYPPAQGDEPNPARGTGAGPGPQGSGGPGYIPYNPQSSDPYMRRYQTYNPNQDPVRNPNPNRPNPYPSPNPNLYNNNRNLYPNQNPVPNPNLYPNGNQRPYPNPNPYPNNPYPNQYPNRYPNTQNTQQSETPFLEIDPIESHRPGSDDSSTGSSDFSALESRPHGSRDVPRTRYGWIDKGMTECSASCAGGIQHTRIDCIEWQTFRTQDPNLCDGLRKPSIRQQSCNIEACPPLWEVTEWMECSRTCGAGRQMRQVMCKQKITLLLTTIIPAERCNPRLEPDRVRDCHNDPCTSWRTGNWGQCDVACGEGRRHREVQCINDAQEVLDMSACADKQLFKPRSQETCDMGPCVTTWFVSEWNDLCSAECGGGHKSRYVVCTTEGSSNVLADEACNTITKPRSLLTCNNMPCGPVWLTSEWSQCSKECGDGTQERMVLCAEASEPHVMVNAEQCAMKPKPSTRQSCRLKECTAMWFNSDWTQCSRTCGGGQRKRDVKCLDADMSPRSLCDEDTRPSSTQACNIQQCTTSMPSSNCRDKLSNCQMVARARFCSYRYYRNNCCFSCHGHQR